VFQKISTLQPRPIIKSYGIGPVFPGDSSLCEPVLSAGKVQISCRLRAWPWEKLYFSSGITHCRSRRMPCCIRRVGHPRICTSAFACPPGCTRRSRRVGKEDVFDFHQAQAGVTDLRVQSGHRNQAEEELPARNPVQFASRYMLGRGDLHAIPLTLVGLGMRSLRVGQRDRSGARGRSH
jgi:hypothetical protein